MPNEHKSSNWIAASCDRTHPTFVVLTGVQKWVVRTQSPYQEVVIADLWKGGRALFLDANLQIYEEDEFVYHEHLVLPALLAHPSPHRVLILGGGDGLALREVLRDQRVEEVVMVELDQVVLDACKEHLAHIHQGSFDHPKANIIVGDARDFLRETDQQFDVAIVDLVDPYELDGMVLYEEVIGLVKRVLAPGGIVATHGETIHAPNFYAIQVRVLLDKHFRHTALHSAHVPSFAGSYGFILASDDVDFENIPTSVWQERCMFLEGHLRALRPSLFPQVLALPPYLEEAYQRFRQHGAFVPPTETPETYWHEGPLPCQ